MGLVEAVPDIVGTLRRQHDDIDRLVGVLTAVRTWVESDDEE